MTYAAQAISANTRRWTIVVEDRRPFPVEAATPTAAELVAHFIVRGMRRAGPIIRMVRDDGKVWIPGPIGEGRELPLCRRNRSGAPSLGG